MPYRLHAALLPVAEKHALEAAHAMQAICAHACATTGMVGALVARGMNPAVADLVVRQWQGAGLTIRPDITAMPGLVAYEPRMARQAVAGWSQLMGGMPLVSPMGMDTTLY